MDVTHLGGVLPVPRVAPRQGRQTTNGGYPARRQFFAHRFCRLLTKAAVANEIGPEACWLLTVVVNLEDAKRYSGPVTFWNEQLMPLCGFGSRKRLVAARQKAIASGWLHYQCGGKARPGLYWVAIPAHFSDAPDGSCDESSDRECRSDSERNAERQRGTIHT